MESDYEFLETLLSIQQKLNRKAWDEYSTPHLFELIMKGSNGFPGLIYKEAYLKSVYFELNDREKDNQEILSAYRSRSRNSNRRVELDPNYLVISINNSEIIECIKMLEEVIVNIEMIKSVNDIVN